MQYDGRTAINAKGCCLIYYDPVAVRKKNFNSIS